jgi:hypothetical protein
VIGLQGKVLEELNSISFQRQFRFKRIVDNNGTKTTVFQAKHLSTTPSWGKHVQFVNYIPSSDVWASTQMALKCVDIEAGTEESKGLKAVEKYKKAILEQGYNYFENEDKLFWINFFEKQKEVARHHLGRCEWGVEWKWPTAPDRTGVPLNPLTRSSAEQQLVDKIVGQEREMYSRTRRSEPLLGDFKDLEENNKFSMIAVAADDDPKGRRFWLAKVTRIMKKEDGIPVLVKIMWYTTELEGQEDLEGKYYPEKVQANMNKILLGELKLNETSVYAYNFSLLDSKMLPAATKRIIETALQEACHDHGD